MNEKRIPGAPAHRRTGRPAPGRPAAGSSSKGSALYRPKRVRAGSTPTRPRKKRAGPKAATAAAPAPLTAPELSEKQRRHLRGLAHELKPVIRLGNAGLTDAVAAETARALHDHELIKIKSQGGADREARDAMFTDLADRTASALIHRIGNVAVLYRPNAKLPRILIPDNT